MLKIPFHNKHNKGEISKNSSKQNKRKNLEKIALKQSVKAFTIFNCGKENKWRS
jgi:hypothetical protein